MPKMMTGVNCVDLDMFLEEFAQLEQKITEAHGRSSLLEVTLEDANRQVNVCLAKEKRLIEEKESLLLTVNLLQQTLREQLDLRAENQRLKDDVLNLKKQNERAAEVGELELQRLQAHMRAEGQSHQRALEVLREQSSRAVEEARREALGQLKSKDAELKRLLQEKDAALEEMKKKLEEQEKGRQSELLKLQMEFGAKLARVQRWAQSSQQPQGSSPIPPSVFKRKLQFLQEEKNKEVAALQQRIRELEENQRPESRLKRRKPEFAL